jgi:multidrug resistance protein, MATE family
VALLTIIAFNFMSFPYGVATAATIRVGNLLGAGRPAAARCAAWAAVATGAASMAVCGVAIAIWRRRLASVFIEDEEVGALVAQQAFIAAAAEVLDGIMGTAQVRPFVAKTDQNAHEIMVCTE